jgi:hypothetical protein
MFYHAKKTEGGPIMKKEYTAIVKQAGDWWIGWIEEIPGVNCQERTHEELIESLRLTLQEALAFNRQDAIAAVGLGYMEEKIAL